MANLTWKCHTCGGLHEGLPTDFAYDQPYYWGTVPEAERERRTQLTPDFCVIDDTDFFVRGLLEIPIIGQAESFRWGVWVSLSRENFERMRRLWTDPRLVDEPPYFCWVSSEIAVYPSTLSLKANVRTRVVTERPYVELEPSDHPLALEQQQGITRERWQELVEAMMHYS